MATFRKRGQSWYVEVRKRGVYRSKTCRTKTQARVWAQDVEDDIEAGSLGSQSLLAGFHRYAAEVSSQKKGARWEHIRLRMFERTMAFVREPMGQIGPDKIAQWRDQRLQSVQPSSVRRELNLVSAVFEQARREWRWLRDNPVRDVRKPRNPPPRHQIIGDAQVAELMAAAGYWRGMSVRTTQQLVAAALDLALETAMRAGEICRLRGQYIDLDRRVLTIPDAKNSTSRSVPLSRGAVEILASLDPEHPFPISSGSLASTFRKIKNKAGVEDITFHDSRATAITRLAKVLGVHDLARMTGHKDLRQLLGYYRETAAEIARRLD